MTKSYRDAVSETANSLLTGKSWIRVLEAGCGSASHLSLLPAAHTVGIDISKEQLDRNAVVEEKIVGDIQEYPLPKEEFDVVVCWMVLEHVPRPKDALLNMFRATKMGGLVILGIPNLLSIKGLATKLTPFWFHELFYRLMKYKSHPFPTYLRADIAPKRLVRFAEENGFTVELFRLVDGGQVERLRALYGFINAAMSVIGPVMRVITFGQSPSWWLDNCFLVLKKQGPEPLKAT